MATVPVGAACYFCLGEEADEEGKQPLVRDCSYRGGSAGFAHRSCLVKYAEQKCKQAGERALGRTFN
jgi:E3 ubiquitin-protein ligase DOA10